MSNPETSDSRIRIGYWPDEGAALEDLEPEELCTVLDALFAELARRWRNALVGDTAPGHGKVPG